MRNPGYNEIVVDADTWYKELPGSVEAILGDRDTHDAFVAAYGLNPDDVPRVRKYVS